MDTPSAAKLRAWKSRSNDEIEAAADTLAEAIYGTVINYRGPCMLQTTKAGRRRPAGLK